MYTIKNITFNNKYSYDFKIQRLDELIIFIDKDLILNYQNQLNNINIDSGYIILSKQYDLQDKIYIFRLKTPYRNTKFIDNFISINDFKNEFDNLYEVIYDYKDMNQFGITEIINNIKKIRSRFEIIKGQIVLKNIIQAENEEDYLLLDGQTIVKTLQNSYLSDILTSDENFYYVPDYSAISESLNNVNTNKFYIKTR